MEIRTIYIQSNEDQTHLFLAVFSMTMTETDPAMAPMFDGNPSSCISVQDIILHLKSFLSVEKITDVITEVEFEVQVAGLNSCSDYEFMYRVLNEESCQFIKSCNIKQDLAATQNQCIITCPCAVSSCNIAVIVNDFINGNTHGSFCEITTL